MSVLGYSEMLKEIYEITPETLERDISKLLNANPSQNKINVLRQLAIYKKATISEMLRKLKLSNTGGSFKSMKNFFLELIRLNIIKRDIIGRRTYYSFKEDSDLQKWLTN